MWKRALLTCGLCLLLAGCGEFVAGGSGADFTGDDFHGGKILASEDWEAALREYQELAEAERG